ncbi:Radical SAM superfamily protein [Planctomycetes bacterium Poly30]|uniref:Radical SAM superfamily protein n=1 Tax=Saltatorellus ferox TaxID=2528018 RepID=A0A518ESA7_9BACT|nr:Radical SAM superfamily protein [Planctomycetes bacterium Poly30]
MPDAPEPGDLKPGDLEPGDHNTPKAEYTLVYPVWSRRAGGLSIGINLNPGKECNWACVYCEVEGLVRGAPGSIDLEVLEGELRSVLSDAAAGRWREAGRDEPAAVRDLCLAGDGEPTLSPDFEAAVEIAAGLRVEHGLDHSSKLVVISNGSRTHRPEVVSGLARLQAAGGELWFKVDAGSSERREALNGIRNPTDRVVESLVVASSTVDTWIQTMAVHPHADPEGVARIVTQAMDQGASPRGILLYGLRRPSHQSGGKDLKALSHDELQAGAEILRRETGLPVRVFE